MRDSSRRCSASAQSRRSWRPALFCILGIGIVAAAVLATPPNAWAEPGWGDCTTCHGPAMTTNPKDGGMLDFGNVLVGMAGEENLTVTNTGGAAGGRAKKLSGDFPASSGAFAIDGSRAFDSLARNASTSRTYAYIPHARGIHTATMETTADNSDGYPVDGSTVTFRGKGVAPIAGVDTVASDAGNVRIGSSGNARLTVQNMGDGNGSELGAVSNLSGTVGSGSGPFVGPGGAVNLADYASTHFDYTYSPDSRGPHSANISLAFANGKLDGTNQAHTVNAAVSGTGVGPEYSGSVGAGSMIEFGQIVGGATANKSLTVSNLTPDADLGALTNLSLLSASITGPGASHFDVGTFSSLLSKGESTTLDLIFDPRGEVGSWTATLSIATDQTAVFGAPGEVFEYTLTGSAVVPEPGTLVLLLSAGLSLCWFVRRRRYR